MDPRASILLPVDSLVSLLDNPDLVVLHVGDSADYVKEHIPGARRVTRDQVSRPRSDRADELSVELPSPRDLEAVLEGLGISDDSRVVVYAAGRSLTRAARVIFTLAWAGLGDRVVLLDGGLEAWKAAGHAVTGEMPQIEPGTLTLTPQPSLVVDAEWVERHTAAPGYALVDARDREFYVGEREDRGKVGHIPGAGSTPGAELADDSFKLKGTEELEQIFRAAGVESGDTVVAYCHIGQYATLAMFAARTLGYDVKLYDGSFQDWAQRDMPVDSTAWSPSPS
jgi:thiosulfate/3-mercaptopyruvate sulfurtransferase